MQEFDNKKKRRILEVLRDDKHHTYQDLFPEATDEQRGQLIESLLLLRGEGLLTMPEPGRTGFAKVPQYAVSIEITPKGHEWLCLHSTFRGTLTRLWRWAIGLWQQLH